MKKYPKWLVVEWKNSKTKDSCKELYWHMGDGEYLDTYSKCYFGCGQTFTYSKYNKHRLPTKAEKLALEKADLRKFYLL